MQPGQEAQESTRALALQVTKTASGFDVELVVDRAWLRDPARVFPLRVDPTFKFSGTSADATFEANCSTCPSHEWERLYVGTDSATRWRSALRFDLSAIPAGVTVSSASLNLLYNGWTVSGGAIGSALTFDVHKLTSLAWNSSTATTADVAFNSTPTSSLTVNPDGWMTWDVTSAVSSWVATPSSNYGFLVKLTNDTTLNQNGVLVPSGLFPYDVSSRPRLDVTFSGDAVSLATPTTLNATGADLSWSAFAGGSFSQYDVHRSTSENFTPSTSTRIATITNVATTSYSDTTATPGTTYSYRIVSNTTPSNEQRVTLPGAGRTTKILQPDGAAGKMAFVDSGWACANGGGAKRAWVGTYSDGSKNRALISWDLSAVPTGSTIVGATMSLWVTGFPIQAHDLAAYRITSPWTEGSGAYACSGDGATWDVASAGTNWTTAGGDYDSGTTIASVTHPPSGEPHWDDFDITTAVRNWRSGTWTNNGLLLRAVDESTPPSDTYIIYAADDYPTNWNDYLRPRLAVTYTANNDAPATPTLDSPADIAALPWTQPALKANASDANNDPLDYQFQVASDSGFTSIKADSGWLTATNTYTVPETALTDGSSYYWRARARDQFATTAWSTARSFSVAMPRLGGQPSTWSQGPVGVNQVTGNLSVTLPGPGLATGVGAMGVSLTYNSLDSTTSQGFGTGWTLAAPPLRLIDHSLLTGTSRYEAVEIVGGDGNSSFYTRIGASNSYRSPAGDRSRLYRTANGKYTLLAGSAVAVFGAADSNGRANLTSTEPLDADAGSATYTYTYSTSDTTKLTKITDPAGRDLTLTWNSLNPTGCSTAILCVSGPDSQTWKYIGDGVGGTSGRVVKVNNGTRDLLSVAYNATSGKLDTLKNANDLDPTNANISPNYDSTHKVTVTYTSGRVTGISESPVTGQVKGDRSAADTTATWSFDYTTSGSMLTDGTAKPHEGNASGWQRTATGIATVTPPNSTGATPAPTQKTWFDSLGQEMQYRDERGKTSQTGINKRGQQLWSEAENGDPTDSTWDAANDVPTDQTESDLGSGLRISKYRYDETKIGTTSTGGDPLKGLRGEYYNNTNLEGRPTARRTDSNVDFTWRDNGPDVLSTQSNYSIRWSGNLIVTSAGDYTLSTQATGRTRLTIDGQHVIENWTEQQRSQQIQTTYSRPVTLSAGTHKIVLEFATSFIYSVVKLRWACPACSTPVPLKEIPSSSLRPDWGNPTSGLTAGGRLIFSHYAKPQNADADYRQVKAEVNGTLSDLVTSYEYDSYGRITKKVMPKGNSGRTIDSSGNLGGTPDNTYATTYAYYGLTETATVPTACGTGTANQAGLLKTKTPNGVAAQTFVYDVAGRIRAITKGAGTSCHTYSNEGRLTASKAPGETQDKTYVYDPAGQVRTVTDASGTVTLDYDEAGRIVKSTDSYGAQAKLVYDTQGNLVSRRAYNGTLPTSGSDYTTLYDYDGQGNLKTLTDPAGKVFRFAYDIRGALKAVQYANGTFAWHTYNDSVQVTKLDNRHGTAIDSSGVLAGTEPTDANAIVEFSYAYAGTDGLDGKITSETRTGSSITSTTTKYSYDGLGRLKQARLPLASPVCRDYLFDADSNRTEIKEATWTTGTDTCGTSSSVETYTYNPANSNSPGIDQLTSRTRGSTTNYTYDSDGRTTGRGSDTITWDGRDRWTGGTFSGTTVSYGFDPLGRTRSRISGSSTTRYLFAAADGDALFDANSSNVIQTTGVEGPAGDLAQYAGPPTSATTITYRYYNGHGDLAAETDASGNRTNAYTYDPFGAPNEAVPANTTTERWVGRWNKRLDTTSNLIRMGIRPYDPVLGRFFSRDPIEGGSLNPYDYSAQDPVNNADLSGRCVWDFCIAEVAAATVVVTAIATAIVIAHNTQQIFRQSNDQATAESGYGDLSYPANQLPVGANADVRYVPPKRAGNPVVVKEPGGRGFIDRKGRIWQWDREENHWDVQLPKKSGKKGKKGKPYIRVSPEGKVLD